MPRKILIVLEEKPEGGFDMYLAGDAARITADVKTPDVQLSPVEFWASRLFSMCIQALTVAGAIKPPDTAPTKTA